MGISHPFPAQARMLLGKPCVAAAAVVPGDVALATQRLRTMRFVGLFEDWATSVCLFHRALRLPAPSKAEVADVDVAVAAVAVEHLGRKRVRGSSLGRFPLVSANFWAGDHLSERSRSVDASFLIRARAEHSR